MTDTMECGIIYPYSGVKILYQKIVSKNCIKKYIKKNIRKKIISKSKIPKYYYDNL